MELLYHDELLVFPQNDPGDAGVGKVRGEGFFFLQAGGGGGLTLDETMHVFLFLVTGSRFSLIRPRRYHEKVKWDTFNFELNL